MEFKRLSNKNDFREVEEEWQYEFMIYVFQGMGMPDEMLSKYFPESYKDFDVDKKIKLRAFLNQEKITLIDDRNGGLKFYIEQRTSDKIENILIAEWKKCRFNYREDPKEIDPAKKMYVEVIADIWVIFESLENEEE